MPMSFFNNTGKRYLFIAASTDTVDSFELVPVVCPQPRSLKAVCGFRVMPSGSSPMLSGTNVFAAFFACDRYVLLRFSQIG